MTEILVSIPMIILYLVLYMTRSIQATVNDIHVSMTANFDSVPLVFEIAEFFHDHHTSNLDPNKLYFNYVNKFIDYFHKNSNNDDTSPSQQDIYQWTISSFQNDIGKIEMESLELALSLNHYTPRLAMFEQLYQDLLINDQSRKEMIIIQSARNLQNQDPIKIVIENNKSINKVSQILKDLKSDAQNKNKNTNNYDWEVFELHDHWIGDTCFNNNNNDRHILMIYYGDYLSSTFKQVYETFASNVDDYCFVLRPITLTKALHEFNLQGYGVELAIKNMEYVVIDDRNVVNVEVGVDGSTQDIKDINKNDDILHTELLDFFNTLLDEKDMSNVPKLLEMEEDDMKQYMTQIDIQAAKALLSGYEYAEEKINAEADTDEDVKKGEMDLNKIKLTNNKFLSIFREFSTNFPRYVESIAHIPNDTFTYLTKYLNTMQRYQREGQQSFSLNGINLATNDFDIFNFYHILHKEAKFVDDINKVMIKYDSNFQNNRLITKLLATPLIMLSELN